MNTTSLHTAFKQAIDTVGIDVLKSPVLASILSDYQAFDTHDPLLKEKKDAVSKLVAEGYTDKLISWIQSPNESWKTEDTQWLEQFCKKFGLKRNIVGLITDAMKLSVGLRIAFDDFTDVPGMLNSAVEEYEAALKRLVKTYTDCLGLKIAYYSPNDNTELMRFSGRVLILANATNSNKYDSTWIDKTKHETLKKSSDAESQQQKVANDVLSKEVPEYESVLKEQLSKGKKGKPVFENTDKLEQLAERLNRAYEITGDSKRVDTDKDIADIKSAIKKYRRKKIVWTVIISIIIGIIAISVTVDRVNYSKYRTEIETFNITIENGDKALANGNSVDALNLYRKAKDEYTVEYRAVKHNEIATTKINEASVKVFAEYKAQINQLLSSDKCKEAKLKYEELLAINPATDITAYSREFEKALTTAVEKNRDSLLKSISKSKGKPTPEDKVKIDDLLYCMPDDYYLNLIKSKIK